MPIDIHALRMFIRLSRRGSETRAFIEQTIQLPLVRRLGDGADMYWGGEAIMIEEIYAADKVVRAEETPDDAPMLAVFRVQDLDAIVTRLRNAGATVSDPRAHGDGREAFYRDSDGYWTGLRERSSGSPLAHDRVAAERHARGETFNPGCKSMPAGIQEIGWIVRRVADLDSMSVFYRDILGLLPLGEEGGHLLFDIGDNVILELAPGGRAEPPPADRHEGSSICIFRIGDMAELKSELKAAGAHIVNENFPIHWAHLMYFADPEGGLLGAEEDFHPGVYAPAKFVLPELLEAERRWREVKRFKDPTRAAPQRVSSQTGAPS